MGYLYTRVEHDVHESTNWICLEMADQRGRGRLRCVLGPYFYTSSRSRITLFTQLRCVLLRSAGEGLVIIPIASQHFLRVVYVYSVILTRHRSAI